MARAMPVGTIRHWEAGDFIKAHDGGIFHNGWIPLRTSQVLEEIGRVCDGLANSMLFQKIPINGEKFLDHEIGEFEKEPGKEFGKYTPDDFKKYEGFAGAARYSFRNEFSRRFMKPKLDVAEAINNALIEANEKKGLELSKTYDQINNDDFLTDDEKVEIRARVRAEMKADAKEENTYFSTKEAEELRDIVKRTKKQLDQGLNFEGEEKKVYEAAVKVGESLSVEYQRIREKRKQRDEAIESINKTFADNWGVRESFKFWIEDRYSEYIRKFKDRIRVDEAKEQESVFGVSLDEAPETFYPKLYKRLQEDPAKYPFQELISLRFETKYDKQMSGNWAHQMLPAVEQIEYLLLNTPQGHFLTNNLLKSVTQEDYNGGENGGYAWYSPQGRRINLSRNLVQGATGQWSRLNHLNEFQSVMAHEVGHAVSNKFGREGNIRYKEFVVACGWSYEQEELRSGRGGTATGSDRDTPRHGSMSHLELLTKYAHKSPEEAFAEYYSLYYNNKKEIDHWLNTGESNVLNKAHKTIADTRPSTRTIGDEFTSSNKTQNRLAEFTKKRQEISRLVDNIHLDPEDHIKVELISPWESKPSEGERPNYDPEKVKYMLGQDKYRYETNPSTGTIVEKQRDITPVIAVNDHQRYELLTGVNTQVQAKYSRRMLPSVSISKELYQALHSRGYSDEEIGDYAVLQTEHIHVPRQESIAKKLSGIEYANQIIPTEKIKESEGIFRKMRAIYESDELKKAVDDLFRKGETDLYFNNYAAVIYLDKENRVLLLKRVDNGQWCFPGGHIDEGEIPLEAAQRELKEETNLSVAQKDLHFWGQKRVSNGKDIYYYLCYNAQDGTTPLANIDLQNEATDFAYMAESEWRRSDMYLDTKDHLEEILAVKS